MTQQYHVRHRYGIPTQTGEPGKIGTSSYKLKLEAFLWHTPGLYNGYQILIKSTHANWASLLSSRQAWMQ